jgi:hypothetical protein
MSDTGIDIVEAYEDVGTSFQILRDGAILSGEYTNSTLNRQVTKPFIREFFREASLPYNTAVVAGDVVKFAPTHEVFLVTSRTPKIFENEVISYESVLYKCNVSGELKRFSGETRDADYHLQPVFQTVKSDCYALVTEGLFGYGISEDSELTRIGLAPNQCYMPSKFDPRLEDRYEPVSGEYYIVQAVKKRQFEAVTVLELNEDTR